jgi:hypothetical protein
MRALILVSGAALAISACSNNGAAGNTANVDQDLAAQNIAANDTTAIDAATGDDANMAADVNFAVNETDNSTAGKNAADNSAGNSEY